MSEKHVRGLPVLEWVVLQLYVFFAMPVFFEGESNMATTFQALSRSGAILEALIAANLFVFCLLAGWHLPRPKRRKASVAPVRHVPQLAVLVYGAVSLVVSFLRARYEYAWGTEWFMSVVYFLFSPTVAQLLLLFDFHNKQKTRSASVVVVFTSVMVVVGLFTGRLDYALPPLITLAIGLFVSQQRVPKTLIAASFAMLLVFNPVKLVYRELTGYRTAEFGTLTVGEMVDAWKESIQQVWAGNNAQQQQALDTTASRLNYLSVNATVIDSVPERIPYALGEPWAVVPVSLVPRVLWPDKPNLTEISTDRFNVLFGMTTWSIAATSTAAYPGVADGFWNLGWLGVAIAGFISGLFWKMLAITWTPSGRLRYSLVFLLVVTTRATAATPSLFVGVAQVAFACFIVVKTLELLGEIGSDGRTS